MGAVTTYSDFGPQENKLTVSIVSPSTFHKLIGLDAMILAFWMFSFQFSSVAQSCLTLCDPMNHNTPGLPSITNSQSLPKPMCIEFVIPSNHLILYHPLLLLPSIFPSIRVFSNASALHIRWPEYWSFSFNISPSNEHPGLISFRMDWLDLFSVQGTLKSLLKHHSSKAQIFQCSAFFIVQLSHPYMTTGKTIALTYSFPNLEPVHCSTSSSICCFLICIQISQEVGQVVWYSHLFQNFP